MVSKLTYYAIILGLLGFAACLAVPDWRASSVYLLFAVPLVVGIVNGIELILQKQRPSGLLLIASVLLLVASVYLQWKP